MFPCLGGGTGELGVGQGSGEKERGEPQHYYHQGSGSLRWDRNRERQTELPAGSRGSMMTGTFGDMFCENQAQGIN